MKALTISLLTLLTISLPDGKAGAQNIWYVDRDADGANTGRSWEDAWNYMDSSSWAAGSIDPWAGINWSIIGDGDTIYVSGGTDSTLYLPIGSATRHWIRPPQSASFNEQVVVAPASASGRTTGEWANHIGDVWFGTEEGRAGLFDITNVSNVKLTGFCFADLRETSPGGGLMTITDSLNVIDNCVYLSRGLTAGIYLWGYKLTIQNCIYELEENNFDSSTDPIGVGGRGGHTIDGNIIIMRNGSMTTTSHRDGIQISDFETPYPSEYLTMTISNNLIIDTRPEGISWTAMIYNHQYQIFPRTGFLIYNNIIVNRKEHTGIAAVAIGKGGGGNDYAPLTVRLLNNTIINKGKGGNTSNIFANWYTDTLIIKNNLFITDTTLESLLNLDVFGSVRDIDYNFYAELGGVEGYIATLGPNRTWQQWQSLGYDLHSFIGNSLDVIFDNKYGLDKADYYTTAGRDAGVDLSNEYPFLAYDILGNPRTGAWDIGALQYSGGQSNNVNVKGKVFLQGPFNANTGSMLTTLNQSDFLPNSQPYNTTPWNYSGNESFSSGPNSTMVDWVLVELRSASNPAQFVARRAAVLKNNGLLLEPNGMEGVYFNNVDPGSYYITVYHRNHLAIMSATPVQLSSNSQLYDFTNTMNSAYGQNPMVELSAGKYGMFASDANGDGVIENLDNDIYLEQRGTMGYKGGDFNMDSGVSVYDVNQFWNINNGAVTQVP